MMNKDSGLLHVASRSMHHKLSSAAFTIGRIPQ